MKDRVYEGRLECWLMKKYGEREREREREIVEIIPKFKMRKVLKLTDVRS